MWLNQHSQSGQILLLCQEEVTTEQVTATGKWDGSSSNRRAEVSSLDDSAKRKFYSGRRAGTY